MTTTIPGSDASAIRHRAAGRNGNPPAYDKSSTSDTSKRAAASVKLSNTRGFNPVDALRVIVGLLLFGSLSSYYFSSGASWSWGIRENRPVWFLDWKALRRSMSGPITLTNAELSAYDGSDPSKPIYLAINRTIYDVSASPHVYGPGGMYSTLAAKDASRSYITTCFDPKEDLVPYLSGVEEVYVPLWLSKNPGKDELDAPFAHEAGDAGVGDEAAEAAKKMLSGKTTGEMIAQVKSRIPKDTMKKLQREAYERARERVAEQIRTWEGMFERKAYPKVGTVVGIDEGDGKWKKLGFCEVAKKQRPNMGESLAMAMSEMGLGQGAQAKGNANEQAAAAADGKGREKVKEKVAKDKAKAHGKKEKKAKAKGKAQPGGR